MTDGSPNPPIAGTAPPDFLGIGAQKAGTTWLHLNFSHHPGIWMPYEKELHYFDEKLGRARTTEEALVSKRAWADRWRRQVERQLLRHAADPSSTDLVWCARFFLGYPDDDWYRSLFMPGPDQIAGEFTPDYAMLDQTRIGRVIALNPDVRVIYMLRNPIERAWSQASMAERLSSGVVTDTDWFAAVLGAPRVRKHTDYLANLDNWLSAVAPDRVFVGFLEDIVFHPGPLLAAVYGFLGLAPDVIYPVMTQKVHSGSIATIPTILAASLAEEYHPQLEALADRFGGYATVWLAIAEDLLRRPPGQPDIRYPFWKSDLAAAHGYRSPTGDPLPIHSAPLDS